MFAYYPKNSNTVAKMRSVVTGPNERSYVTKTASMLTAKSVDRAKVLPICL